MLLVLIHAQIQATAWQASLRPGEAMDKTADALKPQPHSQPTNDSFTSGR